ncbi:hypothetical protein [Streptomyces parvus]|uniref:hypothetical protein n=1 Tax=Streptomyces parvus TaxID=66428 RepID=UPI003D757D9E
MKLNVEVTACDIDKKFPAKTYTITADDGRSISKDLCAEHAEPFEEWLEEAGEAPDPIDQLRRDWLGADEPEAEEEAEPGPVVPRRRTPAKSDKEKGEAPARRTRRRPKVTSLEEIEKSKQS